jgi:hypothetical protein
MLRNVTDSFRPVAVLAVSLGALAAAPAAWAQAPGGDVQPRKPAVTSARPPSPNAMVNLVNLMVKQGLLTEEQGAALIKQAEEEAYVAREAVKGAASKADSAEKTATAAATAASPPGAKHVTYVPEVVKRELREGVRREVMDQAKKEGWASPNTFPEWTSRMRFSGDVRMRYERILYPPGNPNPAVCFGGAAATPGSNDNCGGLVNFNAINTGNPVDLNQIGILPPRDTDQNRSRFRLRARLGVDADLLDGFGAGIRVATGDSSAPISTNQTLGGGGGNFSKGMIWLDRGYLNYHSPGGNIAVSAGRFDNPFFSPTDLLWYNELGFDGAAIQAKGEVAPGIVPFIAAGAFVLYNTPLNFPNNGTVTAMPSLPLGANLPNANKYLFGIQGGVGLQFNDVSATLAAGYFDFNNVAGQLSATCLAATASDSCSTDLLRPSFAQFGNTYMLLRNIDPSIPTDFQFFGLASPFRVVELTGQLDLNQFKPVHIVLDGSYVNNVAFNKSAVAAIAFNNQAPGAGGTGAFDGGNIGAMGRLTVGYPVIDQLWAWNLYVAYKYLQSDATVDAFTDPDFGLGGTNLKGYIVGGRLGLNANVWATAKWMSANSIAGPPFAVDVFQLDLHGKF